jgi:hypothetical protein
MDVNYKTKELSLAGVVQNTTPAPNYTKDHYALLHATLRNKTIQNRT